MQVPSVAPRRRGRMEKAPVYETGECRFDPCRRRSSRRSSVDESTALRRRGSHVRVVPARQALVAQREEHVPGTDEVVGATPTEGSTWKRSGQMRGLSRKQVGVRGPCGCESHRFLHAAVVQRTRRRALNPEAGVRLPVAVLRCQIVQPERTSDCYSDCGGSSPPLAAHRPVAEDRGTRLQPRHGGEIPPGRPSQTRGRRPTARMRARHARDAGSTPAGHTRPTTTRRG